MAQTAIRFGEHLRTLRERAGLTQEGLAERAGLSAQAVAALESGRRRRPYLATLQALADALGLEAEGRNALIGTARGGTSEQDVSLPVQDPSRRHMPVPPTLLVGREREVREVRGLLRGDVRVVTLTGPGGVGKTRLALEVARESAEDFPDGAVFVPLAPVGDPALVLPTIARSLGVSEVGGQPLLETLHSYLQDKRLLLVLDNFEQVLDAAPDMAGLIASCPGLRVLATSRAPLRVRGERESPVRPLPVPGLSRLPSVGEVAEAAAVRLFVERAHSSSPAFALTQANAAAVAAICRRLDGLPLAIELAAARIRSLSPTELLARLDHSLPLLTGGARDLPERQRTMRAAIEWSYELLREKEQALFRGLSVFRGGWDLEAAEAVGAGGEPSGEEVLDLLSSLVEQSLVLAEADEFDSTRYRMLVPVREYAEERLAVSTEAGEAMRRHAGYFLRLAERAEPELRGASQVESLRRLEMEIDNLRVAVGWSLEGGDVSYAIRIARGLSMYWVMRGGHREGRSWMERALGRDRDMLANVRAEALYVLGICEYGLGNDRRLMEVSEECAALYRQVGDGYGATLSSGLVGFAALQMGDLDRAEAILHEAAVVTRELGDQWITALFLDHLAVVPLRRGDYPRARRYAEEALELSRQTGDRLAAYTSLHILAQGALGVGDHQRATRYFGEALEITARLGDRAAIAYSLQGLALVSGRQGDARRVACLLGAAEALLEAVIPPRWAFLPDGQLLERTTSVTREALGVEAFNSARSLGRAMPLQEAVEYGLSVSDLPEPFDRGNGR